MVSFKLCISDPLTGKTFQKEVKDNLAQPFIGLNIGETIKGDAFEMNDYEFLITGGSDYCGFPMRKGILGLRKSIIVYGGVGFRGDAKGIKRRKTVCGHKIHERISQINLKVIKQGSKKLTEIFAVAEEPEKEVKAKEKKKEEKKETKKETIEVKKEEIKEQKIKEEKKEVTTIEQKEEKKETKEYKKSAKDHKEEKKQESKEQKEEKKE